MTIAEWQLINDGNMCYCEYYMAMHDLDYKSPRPQYQLRLRPLLDTCTSARSCKKSNNFKATCSCIPAGMAKCDDAARRGRISLTCPLNVSKVEMGAWEARRHSEHSVIASDMGTLCQPLGLPVPDDAADNLSLEECIHRWHAQHLLHALTTDVPWLVMQYPRFREMRGTVSRCQRHLHTARTVWLPYFGGENLEIRWAEYAVKGLILHRGATPTSGHYTCLLWNDSEEIWYHKDDLRNKAAPVKISHEQTPSQDIYLIYVFACVSSMWSLHI